MALIGYVEHASCVLVDAIPIVSCLAALAQYHLLTFLFGTLGGLRVRAAGCGWPPHAIWSFFLL